MMGSNHTTKARRGRGGGGGGGGRVNFDDAWPVN